MGKLIHKGLKVDRVLVDVHTAPKPWPDRRITHRVIHEKVREIVTDLVLIKRWIQTALDHPLEGREVRPINEQMREE